MSSMVAILGLLTITFINYKSFMLWLRLRRRTDVIGTDVLIAWTDVLVARTIVVILISTGHISI